MLRRLVSHLLAPADVPAAAAPKADDLTAFGAGAEPGSSGGAPHSLGNWMSSVGSLEETAVEPDKGKEPDGQDGADERATVNKGGVDESAAAATAEKAKIEADAKAVEEAAAAAKAKADAEGKEGDDDRKMPRSNKDWEAYKIADKKRLSAVQEKLTAAETQIKEFQTKYTEVETKLKEKPPTDPEVEARAKQLEVENKALTEKIIELDVTQHPKFKAYYEGGIDKQIGKAKKLVGAEKADVIERILKLPDGDYKKLQLREFVSAEMDDDMDKQQLGDIVIKINDLKEDREAEVEKASQHKDKLVVQRQTAAATQQKQLQTAFESTLKQLQDPKDGMIIYQKRDGDAAWNAEVDKTIDMAKRILSSNNLKPETISKLTFDALAFPKLLTTFHAKMTEWNADKAKLEAQVKELTAAQPGGRGNGGGSKTNGNGAERSIIKDNMTPHDASKAWATRMSEAANASE